MFWSPDAATDDGGQQSLPSNRFAAWRRGDVRATIGLLSNETHGMAQTPASLAEHLVASALFRGLDADCRLAVVQRLQPVTFEPAQLIFSRGDPGHDLYLVIEGRVRLSIVSLDGRELAFDHATPGMVFGEIAVLDGGTRSATATALTRCRAMRLSRQALLDLMAQHHRIALATIAFLCARLRDVSDQLEDIALLPVEVRLARYLMRLLGETPAEGGHAPGTQRLRIQVSQAELGFLLGASRQKVNAAMASLEDQQAVRRAGDVLECAPDVLRAIAEG